MNNRHSSATHDLTIILTDPAQLALAVELAGTAMALDGRAALHLRDQAVDLLMHILPELRQAIEDGAEVTYCPTSAADRGIDMDLIDREIEAAGLVSIYARLGDARLLVL
jgi:predicted peroxiredoxin